MSWQHRPFAAALVASLLLTASHSVPAAQDESTPAAEDQNAEKPREKAVGDKAVAAALDKKVDAQFIHFPLEQFAEWIEQVCRIEVEIDARCVADAGLDPASIEFSIDHRDATLRSLLHHTLRPCGLAYVISNGALLITTPEAAATHLVVEIYPTADLARFRGPDGAVSENAEHIIELVTTVCSAASWDAVGGSGTISHFDGMLVVGQSQEVQTQVAALLATMRASIAAAAQEDIAPRKVQLPAANETTIKKALEASKEYSLVQMPLMQFAETIEQQTKSQVMVDFRAFADVGVEVQNVELNADFAPAPLASILNRALAQHGLAYIVDHEAIVITTEDRAASTSETFIYPVADLIARDQPAPANAGSRSGELVELLTANVDAATWDDVGGPGHMQFAAPWNLLVVSAPPSTQRKLADTLEKLRDARRREVETNLEPSDAQAADDPIELRVFALGDATAGSAETAEKIADVIRDLVPELAPQSAPGESDSYLRALPDRMVVRHRRSVLEKVEKLLKQLETPKTSNR